MDEISVASKLPKEVLHEIFGYLRPIDMVSCGQVSQLWREVAKDPRLWRRVELDYMPGSKRQYGFKNWHGFAKPFLRIIRFAPALKFLKVIGPVMAGVRKAISASSASVQGVSFDGSKDWSVRFLLKHKEELTSVYIWNADGKAVKAAASLPNVTKLIISYPQFPDYDELEYGSAKKKKAPPSHSFVAGELPKLREVTLIRVPKTSAETLLFGHCADLDFIDVDNLQLFLPNLPKFAKLERLVLRGHSWYHPSWKENLQKSLPDLMWLEELLFFMHPPSPRHMKTCEEPFFGCWCGDDNMGNDWDEEDEYADADDDIGFIAVYNDNSEDDVCRCVKLAKGVMELNNPLIRVVCQTCNRSPDYAKLEEEDMERFVYRGPYKPRRKK